MDNNIKECSKITSSWASDRKSEDDSAIVYLTQFYTMIFLDNIYGF